MDVFHVFKLDKRYQIAQNVSNKLFNCLWEVLFTSLKYFVMTCIA